MAWGHGPAPLLDLENMTPQGAHPMAPQPKPHNGTPQTQVGDTLGGPPHWAPRSLRSPHAGISPVTLGGLLKHTMLRIREFRVESGRYHGPKMHMCNG